MEVELDKTSYSRESRAFNPEHQAAVDRLRLEQSQQLEQGEYYGSHQTKTDREAAETRMQSDRFDREKQRQAKERIRLDKGWVAERDRFEREWDVRRATLGRKSRERLRVLAEVQLFARDAHEALQSKRGKGMHYRMSKGLLEYSLTERSLALGERYDEASTVKKRADVMRTRDSIKKKSSWRQIVLNDERGRAEEKLYDIHVPGRLLRQKYKNLTQDVEHAFTMEFHTPPICEVVLSNVSRGKQSSAFRGTLKLESLSGSKGAIPNLSELPDASREDTDPALAPWRVAAAVGAR
ncbi:hypothetical protein T492DRAFT_1101425 [Pavlovales sp. CCMP2436]|nr:hypothetical protein T492DRAFT_1101425 [Pavlovales sp. CCMP2436]